MTVDKKKLDAAFNPRTVAVVGAKQVSNYNWLRNMDDFQGKVYSVQIDPSEIPGIEALGIPNYHHITEVPEEVDYAVIAVPRRVVPIILQECIQKGVKTVHVFASSFAETGLQEGIEAQERITQMAREADILLIGPNCMGVFNPAVGMKFGFEQKVGPAGPVTFIAQSGGHAGSLTQAAQANGIGINKTISFGNAAILDSPDLLEYFAADEGTKVIAMYVEGPRDGRRFFMALQEATKRKPVIVWKGGQTEDGMRAVSSHTGALAGSAAIWDAMVRQAGAVRADSLEETIDVTKALLYLPPTSGTGVGIIGGTGGQSVSMTDAFAKQGLRVPRLSPESLDRLAGFFQLVGASYFNPIDIGGLNRHMLETIVDILFGDPLLDAVVVQLGATLLQGNNREEGLAQLDLYRQARDKTGKPVLAILNAPNAYRDGPALDDLDKTLQGMSIPSFPNPDRAAQVLRKVVDYYRHREGVTAGGRQ